MKNNNWNNRKSLPNWYFVAAILFLFANASLTALCSNNTASNFTGDPIKNIASSSVPSFVEQQLRAMARVENPPPAGLHLSQDGKFFTYASASSDANHGSTRASGYQVTLGLRLSDGIEILADQTELSLKFSLMKAGLSSATAIEERGHLVYPSSGMRYEYEFKKNGLKENIILESARAKDLNLAFVFRQDASLDFKLDTKGNVLVYGPDPMLSGFAQTGDEKSAELLMKARRNATKDHLLFLIPAPIISDANGKQ